MMTTLNALLNKLEEDEKSRLTSLGLLNETGEFTEDPSGIPNEREPDDNFEDDDDDDDDSLPANN